MIKITGFSPVSYNLQQTKQKTNNQNIYNKNPYSTNVLSSDKISFKGSEEKYSLNTFNTTYQKAMGEVEKLKEQPNSVFRRSQTLGVHYHGVKSLIEKGNNAPELYNAFLELANKYFDVKLELNAPKNASYIILSSEKLIQEHPPEETKINKNLLESLHKKAAKFGETIFSNTTETDVNIKNHKKESPLTKMTDKQLQNEVNRFIHSIDNDYLNDLDEILYNALGKSKSKQIIEEASTNIVKNGGISVIKQLMEDAGETPSKRDTEMLFEIIENLHKLSKTDTSVLKQVASLIEDSKISNEVKKLISFRF